MPPLVRALADVRRQPLKPIRQLCETPDSHRESDAPPELVQIDWARVVAAALKTSSQAGDVADVDIDLENMAAVMRTRARHTVEDLKEPALWMFMMVFHLSRSPTSMLMNVVQQLKGPERRGRLSR